MPLKPRARRPMIRCLRGSAHAIIVCGPMPNEAPVHHRTARRARTRRALISGLVLLVPALSGCGPTPRARRSRRPSPPSSRPCPSRARSSSSPSPARSTTLGRRVHRRRRPGARHTEADRRGLRHARARRRAECDQQRHAQRDRAGRRGHAAPARGPGRGPEDHRGRQRDRRTPYKWGGGHGRFLDTGYDCSGWVSFALYAAGLIEGPRASGGLMAGARPVRANGSALLQPRPCLHGGRGHRLRHLRRHGHRLTLAERPARPQAGLGRPPPARSLGWRRTSLRRRLLEVEVALEGTRLTSLEISPARRMPSIASRCASIASTIMRPHAELRSSIAASWTSSSKRAAKHLRR